MYIKIRAIDQNSILPWQICITCWWGSVPTMNLQSLHCPDSRRCWPRSQRVFLVICQSYGAWYISWLLVELIGVGVHVRPLLVEGWSLPLAIPAMACWGLLISHRSLFLSSSCESIEKVEKSFDYSSKRTKEKKVKMATDRYFRYGEHSYVLSAPD